MIRPPHLALFFVLTLVPTGPAQDAPPTAAAPTAPDATWRAVDVSALTDSVGAVDIQLPVELPIVAFDDQIGGQPARWRVRAEPPISVAELATWLGVLLQEQQLGGSDLVRAAGNGMLLVGGGPQVEAEVRKQVAALLQALLPQYELRIFVLPPAAVAAGLGPSLQPVEVERLLTRFPAVRTHLVHLAGGVPQQLVAGKQVPVLYDWNVEVAQAAGIADPQLTALTHGLVLVCAAHPLADGQVQLLLAGRDTAVEQPVAARQLGAKELGQLQFPRAHSAVRMCCGVLAEGAGLLIGDAERPGSLWLVQLRAARRAADPAAAFEFVPLPRWSMARSFESDQQGAVRLQFQALEAGSHGNNELRHLLLEGNPWRAFADDETDVLPFALPEHESRIAVLRSGILLAGPESLREGVRQQARAFAAAAARPANLALRAGFVPQEQANALLDGRTPVAEVAGALGWSALLPTVVGRPFRCATGFEQSHVGDYLVEIAQEKTTLNPVIEARFHGFLIEGRLLPQPDGRVRLVGRFEAGRPAALEPLATGNENVGTFELVGSALVADRLSLPLDANQEWQLLCCQSLPGVDEALVALVRVRN